MHKVPIDEKKLLARVAAGDEQAFALLFDQHFHTVGAYIHQITRSHELAEEVVQDVFLKIWIAREALLEVRDFPAYLFIASRNQAINAVKKVAREAQHFPSIEASIIEEELVEDIQVQEIEDQYYSLLDQAIDRLPQQQKMAFISSRINRKKYEEIAREMNLSKETVKKYIQYATRSVSDYVRDHMDPMLVAVLLVGEYQLLQLG